MASKMSRSFVVLMGILVLCGITVGGCFWVVGSAFNSISKGSFQNYDGRKGYKNYVKEPFVYEAVKNIDELQTDNERSIETLNSGGQLIGGDFVVIPIDRVIDSSAGSYQTMFDRIYIAASINQNTKAVILYVNSPGGSVTVTDQLHHEILKLKTHGIKVITYVNGMSASGAVYMTADSDKIIASPTSFLGSIGVIMQLYNFEGLVRKIGVRVETIKSTESKDIGSPFRRMSEKERKTIQNLINDSYERFISIVAHGRKLSRSEVEAIATGEIWTAGKAKELGLADDVGYMSKAVDVAKELTGVTHPSIVIYEKKLGFYDLFEINFSGKLALISQEIIENSISAPRILYQWVP